MAEQVRLLAPDPTSAPAVSVKSKAREGKGEKTHQIDVDELEGPSRRADDDEETWVYKWPRRG